MESSTLPTPNKSLHESVRAVEPCNNMLNFNRSNNSSVSTAYGDSRGLALDVIVVSPTIEFTAEPEHNGVQPEENDEEHQPPAQSPSVSVCKRTRKFKTSFPREKEEFDGNHEPSGIFASSDFAVQFPDVQDQQQQQQQSQHDKYQQQSTSSSPPPPPSQYQYLIRIQINGALLEESFLSMRLPPHAQSRTNDGNKGRGGRTRARTRTGTAKQKTMCIFSEGMSSKPPTSALEQMTRDKTLIAGKNMIRYILIKREMVGVTSSSEEEGEDEGIVNMCQQDTPIGLAEANIFLWSVHDRIVISDIDGTVTKSDVRGVIDSIILKSNSYAHDGVCEFFSKIVNEQQEENGEEEETCDHDEDEGKRYSSTKGQIRILYLSSRPISLISTTRTYLSQLYQSSSSSQTASNRLRRNKNSFSAIEKADFAEDRIRLPNGPIFLHTGSLGTVLVTELVNKSTHLFKADALERQVVLPFIAAGKDSMENTNIFVAAFGNKETDKKAYEMAGIEQHDIYIINKRSVIASTSEEGGIKPEIDDDFTVIDHACCCINDASSSPPVERYRSVSEVESSKTNPSSRTTSYTYTSKEVFKGYGDPNLTDAVLNRMKKTRVP